MNKEKVNLKEFLEKNKVIIIIGGGLGLYLLFVHYKKKLMYNTAIVSFQETISWFEKEFPEMHLRELWIQWAKDNPSKVRYLKM